MGLKGVRYGQGIMMSPRNQQSHSNIIGSSFAGADSGFSKPTLCRRRVGFAQSIFREMAHWHWPKPGLLQLISPAGKGSREFEGYRAQGLPQTGKPLGLPRSPWRSGVRRTCHSCRSGPRRLRGGRFAIPSSKSCACCAGATQPSTYVAYRPPPLIHAWTRFIEETRERDRETGSRGYITVDR